MTSADETGHVSVNAEDQEGFLSYPLHRVVGVVDDPDDAAAAVEALREAGFPPDEIDVFCGEEGAERLDPSGEAHGWLSRLARILQQFGVEGEHTQRHAEELRAGHFLIAVLVADEDDEQARQRVVDLLAAHRGHFINYYGSNTVEGLQP